MEFKCIRHRASGTRRRVVLQISGLLAGLSAGSLPESIRSTSDPPSGHLTESLQGVPAGGSEHRRAHSHAIASFLRL